MAGSLSKNAPVGGSDDVSHHGIAHSATNAVRKLDDIPAPATMGWPTVETIEAPRIVRSSGARLRRRGDCGGCHVRAPIVSGYRYRLHAETAGDAGG